MASSSAPAYAAGLNLSAGQGEKLRFLAEAGHFMIQLRRLDGARRLYEALRILSPDEGFFDVQLAFVARLEDRPAEMLSYAESAAQKGRMTAGSLALALSLQGLARLALASDPAQLERAVRDAGRLFARARRLGQGTCGGLAAEELARSAAPRNEPVQPAITP